MFGLEFEKFVVCFMDTSDNYFVTLCCVHSVFPLFKYINDPTQWVDIAYLNICTGIDIHVYTCVWITLPGDSLKKFI